ncbi:MAG: dihydroxyacetone kinase subunit DhaL [Clostridiaceae bacterium]|nr:dihydroxyacetone kinase subunit DhaL [Clostridiaceae bacterium]
MTKLSQEPDIDISSGLKKVGMALISSVGGASGPLYGTAFMRAAVPAQGKTVLDKELAGQMLHAVLNGIKERGKACRGEKTIVDSLEPAYDAFVLGIEEDKSLLAYMEMACNAAEKGVEYTKTIIAKKGRASYLVERSIGHQDPGATSTLIILKTLTNYCRENG